MPQFEAVLNKPLTGEEVREIILVKIDEMLKKDCRLADHFAFPSFKAKFSISIQLEGAVHNKIEREVEVKVGEVGLDPEVPTSLMDASEEIEAQPPNEARVDAGLPVPVLTRDEKGRQIEKKVKYAKRTTRNADPVA